MSKLMMWQSDDPLEKSIEKGIEHALNKYEDVISIKVNRGLSFTHPKYPVENTPTGYNNVVYIEVEKYELGD